MRTCWIAWVLCVVAWGTSCSGQVSEKVPTKDDLLRGGYGPYRANNDLLFYHLKVRVDPVAKTIAGTNLVRFRMLEDGQKIQLELTPELTLGAITFEGKALLSTREERTLWVELPRVLKQGDVAEVTVAYAGKPVAQGRFQCFAFDKDKEGKPWITTSCEDEGASSWWPCKDQWRDEPQDGMEIDVAVPDGLMDVSNGRLVGSKDLGDGYTEWQWRVHYPINAYDVALNIGEYVHWSGVHVHGELVAAAGGKQVPRDARNDRKKGRGDDSSSNVGGGDDRGGKDSGKGGEGETTLDYYALPEDVARAKVQYAQVPGMLDAFEHYFGEYPFDEDGYKVVEVPYAGMEHQTAIAYGNHFENGYDAGAPRGNDPEPMAARDWTKVGISPKFDFILVHESGHEWFGNAVTAADPSDMWIHESWTTYMESLYVEYRWGKAEALRYLNGRKGLVDNKAPIITARGTNTQPPRDQYDKGALMINTLRSVVDDDAKWFADLRDFFQAFKYRTVMTEDVVAWWSERTGIELRPFFDAYLRHADIPVLVLAYDSVHKYMLCSWKTDEPGFDMPIKVGNPEHWIVVQPAVGKNPKAVGEDGRVSWSQAPDDFKVASELYYVVVERQVRK